MRQKLTIPSFKREIHSNVISNLNGSRNFAGFFNTLILVILTRLITMKFQQEEKGRQDKRREEKRKEERAREVDRMTKPGVYYK